MRGTYRRKFVNGIAVCGFAALAMAATPALARDCIGERDIVRWKMVDSSSIIVWGKGKRAYEVGMKETCEMLDQRPKLRFKAMNRGLICGAAKDRVLSGYTSCPIASVKKLSEAELASLIEEINTASSN